MKYYHGEVKTGNVYNIADEISPDVNRLGGQLYVGLSHGLENDKLLIELPDSVESNPSDLFQSTGVTFEEVRRSQVPAVEDHGIL